MILTRLAAGTVSLAIIGLVMAPSRSGGADNVVPAESAPAPSGERANEGPPPTALAYVVRLHVDGNLVGRVRISDEHGVAIPHQARLGVLRNGELVDAALTTESGYFQLTRLVPGDYQMIVVSELGVARIEVQLLPFDRNAAPDETFLDILLRIDDFTFEEMATVPVEKMLALCEEPCVGGGHHPHHLLGLAGLAGLAGLGDGHGEVVSPCKPDPHR